MSKVLTRSITIMVVSLFMLSTVNQSYGAALCNFTKHVYLIDKISKGTEEECNVLKWRERCYIGNCNLEVGHGGEHDFSAWKLCTDPSHPEKEMTARYCKGKENKKKRDDAYRKLEKEKKEREAKEGYASVVLPPSEEEGIVCSVSFTALEGETAINTKYTGKITSIKFTAVDGRELTQEDVPDVKVKERDGWTILDIPKGIGIVGGIITGVERIIKILSPKEKTEVTTTPPKDKIIPTDGEIEVTNGNIDETITGEDIFDITKPGENIVSIVKPETNVEYPIDIIAARIDEINVVGTDIPLDVIGPEGICKVKVTKPDAASITSDVPSWGYNLSMPPVTQTGVPVPITAYVCGVKGKKVEFKFIPEEGQAIEPLMVTLSTEELGKPTPIAKLTTTKIGPQTLNCEVVIIK
ncbi:MAG: hypothetical protein AB1414_15135 [bacterium]